jgi:DNA-directed RNA polymerase subunit RPC12/RpoP
MKKKRRKKAELESPFRDEAAYVCAACGEEIVVPLDISAGTSQRYVEDCPVCCHPNLIAVEIDEDGSARVWSEPE